MYASILLLLLSATSIKAYGDELGGVDRDASLLRILSVDCRDINPLARQDSYGSNSLKRRNSFQSQSYDSNSLQRSNSYLANSSPPKCQPTVKPSADFDPEKDATKLRDALHGWFPDKTAVISVLGDRSLKQRLTIAFAFKSMFGSDLIEKVKKHTDGTFQSLLLGLLTPFEEYYARKLRRSVKGWGTSEDVIIEMLISLNNDGIERVSKVYKKIYGSQLQKDLERDTSGRFKHIVVSLLSGGRNENPRFENDESAVEDAKKLYQVSSQVGERQAEDTFHTILMTRSYQQVGKISDKFKILASITLEEAIGNMFSGSTRTAYKHIVRYSRNPAYYFATKLQHALSGVFSYDHKAIIRILVTRSEVDLGNINLEYKKVNEDKVTLKTKLAESTSGDYNQLILALMKHV